jgi:hypothetical protein
MGDARRRTISSSSGPPCIRKRRGKYVVDYRDAFGRRRWVTCDTRRESERVLSERLRTPSAGPPSPRSTQKCESRPMPSAGLVLSPQV